MGNSLESVVSKKDSEKLENTKEIRGEPIGDSDSLLDQVKSARRLSVIMISIAFFVSISMFVGMVIIFKLAKPEVREFISYINDEQRVVTEESISSIPTINSSRIFVRECLRKIHQFASNSYAQTLNEAQYCMDPTAFDDLKLDSAKLVDSYFTQRGIVGGFTVNEMKVDYTNDISSPSPIGPQGCSRALLGRYPGSLNCRTYSFSIDTIATNYATGRKSPVKFDGFVNLIIGNRRDMPNGMYIQFIYSK